MKKFLTGNWWHLFCAFYMIAIIAYIVFFAVVHHILMAGFLVSTLFMLGIELYIFATSRKSVV